MTAAKERLPKSKIQNSLSPKGGKSKTIANRQSSIANHLLALAFYLVLTLFFAWPAITNLSVGTPGHFAIDRSQNFWNFWWFKRSLLETHTNPFQTGYIFYPYGASLYLHTLSPINVLLGIPLQLLFGLIPTFGLLQLSTFVLSGYTMWLLARYILGVRGWGLGVGQVPSPEMVEGRRSKVKSQEPKAKSQNPKWLKSSIPPVASQENLVLSPQSLKSSTPNPQPLTPNPFFPALFAGLVYSFSAYHYAVLDADQINMTAIQWLPLVVLFMLKAANAATPRASVKYCLIGAFCFLLVLLNDFYHAIWLLMFAGLLWLWRVVGLAWQQRAGLTQIWRPIGILTAKLVGLFGLALLLYSPVLWATVKELQSGKYPAISTAGESQTNSADLSALFLPPAHQPWWGANWQFWQANKIFLHPDGAVIGWVALGLAVYAAWRWRGLGFWLFQAIFWTVLALGPYLRLNGQETKLVLPYNFLTYLPILNVGRTPQRMILLASLALAVLAAFGVARLLQFKPNGRPQLRYTVVGLLFVACFVENFPGILPPPDKLGGYAFADFMSPKNSTVPANKAVLELPMTKFGKPDRPTMLYAVYHQRPITGGYLSRNPLDPYRANNSPLFEFAQEINPANNQPEIVPAVGRDEWNGILNTLGVGYVVYYREDVKRAEDQTRLDSVVATYLGAPVFSDETARVYQVTPTPLNRPVLLLGDGWQPLETKVDGNPQKVQRWLASGQTAGKIKVVSPVGTPQNFALEIEAASYLKPRRLQIWLNGQMQQEIEIGALAKYQIAGLNLRAGENDLQLIPNPQDGADSPAQNGAPNDKRQLAIVVRSINWR